MLLTGAALGILFLPAVVQGKLQQPFIEATNYINFSYLTKMLIIMTVSMVGVMVLIVLIDIFLEDQLPKLKLSICGGRPVGRGPRSASSAAAGIGLKKANKGAKGSSLPSMRTAASKR